MLHLVLILTYVIGSFAYHNPPLNIEVDETTLYADAGTLIAGVGYESLEFNLIIPPLQNNHQLPIIDYTNLAVNEAFDSLSASLTENASPTLPSWTNPGSIFSTIPERTPAPTRSKRALAAIVRLFATIARVGLRVGGRFGKLTTALKATKAGRILLKTGSVALKVGTVGTAAYTAYELIAPDSRALEIAELTDFSKDLARHVINISDHSVLINTRFQQEILNLQDTIDFNFKNLNRLTPLISMYVSRIQSCFTAISSFRPCIDFITLPQIKRVIVERFPSAGFFLQDPNLVNSFVEIIPKAISTSRRLISFEIFFLTSNPTDFRVSTIYKRTSPQLGPCTNTPTYLVESGGDLFETDRLDLCQTVQEYAICTVPVLFRSTLVSNCWETYIPRVSTRTKRYYRNRVPEGINYISYPPDFDQHVMTVPNRLLRNDIADYIEATNQSITSLSDLVNTFEAKTAKQRSDGMSHLTLLGAFGISCGLLVCYHITKEYYRFWVAKKLHKRLTSGALQLEQA